MEKNSINNILISKRVFVISTIAAMFLGMVLSHLLSNKTPQILYVSEEEILALENERISNDKYETRELFFGQSKDVPEKVISLANRFKNKNAFVVFSKGKIFGDNVRSISSDVPNRLIGEIEGNE